MKNSPWNSAGNLEGPFFSVSFFTSFAWKSFLAIAYALIAKGVRLVCTNTIAKNARSVVQKTQGSGSLKENIITAFGSSTFSYLEPVSPSISDGCVVEGFVSKSGNRSGWNIGDRQFFFVNGRPVDMSKVGKLVNELYRGANSKQYPIAILNFNLPTRAYDVNVTPDKRKIFFSDESSILQSSREALEKIYSSNQKLKTSANELTIWEDIPLTDAEDHGAAKDQPVPMSLEQSEFKMMEKNQMPKLKTYLKRGCFDVVGYVEDIYAYYNKMEISSCVSPRYMAHQFDINERMRAILIDWLIKCRARSYAASDPSDMSEARKTWRRVSKDERKSMVEDYVNKYREMNAGKFPTAYDAKKDVGGSY